MYYTGTRPSWVMSIWPTLKKALDYAYKQLPGPLAKLLKIARKGVVMLPWANLPQRRLSPCLLLVSLVGDNSSWLYMVLTRYEGKLFIYSIFLVIFVCFSFSKKIDCTVAMKNMLKRTASQFPSSLIRCW